MPDATAPVPRSSPSRGRVWLLPSSPFETLAGERSQGDAGKTSVLLGSAVRPRPGGSPLPPPRSAAA